MAIPKTAGNVANQGVKAANVASAVSAGGDLAATAINLISGISDQKKRALFQNNLAFLTLDQQSQLEKTLINANSESERLKILTSALSNLNAQRISGIATIYAEQEKKKRNQQLLIIGGVVVFGAIVVTLILKKS